MRAWHGVLLAAWLPLAAAAADPGLSVTGQVSNPRTLGLAELQALPAVTVEVSHPGADGAAAHRYTGALLWPVLVAAAPVDGSPRSHLQHTLLARGEDGYAVSLAIGELDPGFEGKQVLIAYAEDGKPLPALRLVVPGDAKAGRSVRDLVSVEVH